MACLARFVGIAVARKSPQGREARRFEPRHSPVSRPAPCTLFEHGGQQRRQGQRYGPLEILRSGRWTPTSRSPARQPTKRRGLFGRSVRHWLPGPSPGRLARRLGTLPTATMVSIAPSIHSSIHQFSLLLGSRRGAQPIRAESRSGTCPAASSEAGEASNVSVDRDSAFGCCGFVERAGEESDDSLWWS
jgi:hypothetical protein